MDLASADTQKQITQQRSLLEKDPNDHPAPGISPIKPAAAGNPERTVKTLHKAMKNCDKNILADDTQTEECIRQLEAGKDPPGMAFNAQVNEEMLADPNWRDLFRQRTKRHSANVCAEKEAIEAVMLDGERRARATGRREDGRRDGV